MKNRIPYPPMDGSIDNVTARYLFRVVDTINNNDRMSEQQIQVGKVTITEEQAKKLLALIEKGE